MKTPCEYSLASASLVDCAWRSHAFHCAISSSQERFARSRSSSLRNSSRISSTPVLRRGIGWVADRFRQQRFRPFDDDLVGLHEIELRDVAIDGGPRLRPTPSGGEISLESPLVRMHQVAALRVEFAFQDVTTATDVLQERPSRRESLDQLPVVHGQRLEIARAA